MKQFGTNYGFVGFFEWSHFEFHPRTQNMMIIAYVKRFNFL